MNKSKFVAGLKSVQGIAQIVGIVVSSLLAAFTALQVGGDPMSGAAIGAALNTTLMVAGQ